MERTRNVVTIGSCRTGDLNYKTFENVILSRILPFILKSFSYGSSWGEKGFMRFARNRHMGHVCMNCALGSEAFMPVLEMRNCSGDFGERYEY